MLYWCSQLSSMEQISGEDCENIAGAEVYPAVRVCWCCRRTLEASGYEKCL